MFQNEKTTFIVLTEITKCQYQLSEEYICMSAFVGNLHICFTGLEKMYQTFLEDLIMLELEEDILLLDFACDLLGIGLT